MPTPVQRDILDRVPGNVKAVAVTDRDGNMRWRAIPGAYDPEDKNYEGKELQDSDEIRLKKDHRTPITQKQIPGFRPDLDSTIPYNSDKAENKAVLLSAHSRHDPLLQAIEENPEGIAVFHEGIKALARECSRLEFARIEAERNEDKSVAGLSQKRVSTLNTLLSLWFKRSDQTSSKSIDLDGKEFAVVFGYIIETFEKVLRGAGLQSNQIKSVAAALHQEISHENWKVEAKNRLRDLG